MRTTRFSTLVLLLFIVLGAAGAASALAQEEQGAVTATAGQDGFSLKSADGAFEIQLRGYVHTDGRFWTGDDELPATDTFLLRRVRPILEGTLYKFIDFRIMPDFGEGRTQLADGYLEARLSPALRVRAGKFKLPIGLERLQSATDIVFVERGQPANLAPNRDVGVQLSGDLVGGRIAYAVGAFNGVPDGTSGDTDIDDGKDAAARLFVQPFASGDGPWKGLGSVSARAAARSAARLRRRGSPPTGRPASRPSSPTAPTPPPAAPPSPTARARGSRPRRTSTAAPSDCWPSTSAPRSRCGAGRARPS